MTRSPGAAGVVLTDDDTLEGRIFFRLGDDSGFQATRAQPGPQAADLVGRLGRGHRR